MQAGDFLDFVMRWSGAAGEAARALCRALARMHGLYSAAGGL